jgi:hypothetical protein
MAQNLLVMFAPVIIIGIVFAVVFAIQDRRQTQRQ